MNYPARVYLVRHGKAEREGEGGDSTRRLTQEGRVRFFTLVANLARRLDLVRIVTSPFARARDTAEILAAATGAPVQGMDELAAGRSTGREILALARRVGPGVALVGHNPEMAEAIALVAGHEERVKPGTVAALDLEKNSSALAWLEAPERPD
ncbi:MAG TPA: histidine phosphatase family protein [Anaeromyxobacteraceae bacterium]|nr:histidine phosphatase family protein [Anaeromyxobacteraceae bacterium]